MLRKLAQRAPSRTLGRSFGLYQPQKEYGPTYHEHKRYKALMKEEKAHQRKLFQDKQAEIDLDFLKKHEEENYDLMVDYATKARSDSAIGAFRDQEKIREKKKKEDVKEMTIRQWMMDEEINKANRKRILATLELDSKNWFTELNLTKTLEEHVIVPENVEHHNDYYRRLQEATSAYHLGQFDEYDSVIYQERVIGYKNSIMVPLYQRVRGLIRFFKQDAEDKLLSEYEASRAIILQKFAPEEAEKKLGRLDKIYNGLIIAFKKELKKPDVLVRHLHRRYLILYNILHTWKEYTSTMRMSAEEAISQMEQRNFQEDLTQDQIDELKEAHQSSDEDLATSEDERAEFSDLKKTLKESIEISERAVGNKDSRLAEHDSEYDTETKSIEDTTMGTSEVESSSEAEIRIEDLISWDDLDIKADDDLLDEEFEGLDEMAKMYGSSSDANAIKVDELLTKFEIERLIPKDVTESTFDFSQPSLLFDSIKKVNDDYEVRKAYDQSILNSSVFTDVAIKALDQMDPSKFTVSDQKKHSELRFLLERIGNIKVNEAKLLVELLETL